MTDTQKSFNEIKEKANVEGGQKKPVLLRFFEQEKFWFFLTISWSRKRFEDFSMRANDSSHRNPPQGHFE